MKKKIKTILPFLTIGYATHNRKKIVRNRLIEALQLNFQNNFEIIFVDNFSPDKTFHELKKLNSSNFISIYKNSKNFGFAGNFIEVILKAKGDYVIWVSDEDTIEKTNIQKIIKYLKINKPDSLVLNHFKKNKKKLFPIRLNTNRLIEYFDLWETCHLPGIVWRKKAIINIIKKWNFYKTNFPQLTQYYPNLILMINLIPFHNSYFHKTHLTFQKDFEKSQHKSIPGTAYSNVVPRWRQHNEILKLINLYSSKSINQKNLLIFDKMKKYLNRNIYTFISNSIYEENKEIYYYFARSSYPMYILRRNFKFFLKALKFFIYDPVTSLYIIKKRLRFFYEKK